MSLYQIDKLEENNYDAWCIHMKGVLVHSGYWNIVNGNEKKEEATNVRKWIADDEKALATITLCVHASQLNHIKNCKTSSEAWNTLQEVFRPTGPVKKVYLYKQLLNARMSEDGNMSEHIRNFTNTVDKLVEVGIELNEELVTIILLSSLPAQYEQFVVAMETRDSLPSLQNLKIKLLEESERKTQKEDSVQNTQAFMAKTKIQCNDSYNKQNFEKRNENRGKKKSNVCFICGKQGHFAANCYLKNRNENKRDQRQKNFTVLAAADLNILQSNIWCVDSGATAHMTGDEKCFIWMREHNEEITLAGDNYMYAKGIGDVRVVTREGDLILRNVLYVPNLTGNFVSVCKAVDKGIKIKFDREKVEFIDRNNHVVLRARKRNNLFVFENKVRNKIFQMKSSDELKWHKRFGHLNYESLQELQRKKMVKGLEKVCFKNKLHCVTCMKSKIHVKP